jgi:hypothetical protein
MPDTLIISGALAQKPRHGGHTWVFLQYLLGFKRLGWDVIFVDQLEPEMSFDEAGEPCPVEQSVAFRFFFEVMKRFGFEGKCALLCNKGAQVYGFSREELMARAHSSAYLINVMGYLKDEALLGCAPRRVFLDIDPGFGQMWQDLGQYAMFQGHHDYVTIGENIGRPDCDIPTCGIDWITTPQPVVLDYWETGEENRGEAFTGVASWRGAYGTVEYRGKTYGLRVHEFRKFIALPRLTGEPFRLALDIHPAEVNDLALLEENNWTLVDPLEAAGDPSRYQAFIRNSKAELMIAKNIYVQTNSGWFSDRSLCYLAAGKPVLAQETGFSRHYPTGEGLLAFSTPEEAAEGVNEISGNLARHSRAAREIAREYFDSDRVLTRLLEKLSASKNRAGGAG